MRLKRVFLVALLSVVLIVPVVLHLGLVNLSGVPLFSSTATPSGTLSTPTVFVDPHFFVRDYVDLPIGSTFTLSVNISDVTDLFSWQISLNYNSTLLSINRFVQGDFLMRTGSAYKTSSYQLGWVINKTDSGSGIGSAAIADSILGDVSGITGNGRLVSIEFQVLHYGSSAIYLNLTGTTPTTLLNSLGSTVTFTKVDGYFRNKIPGDVNGDKTVNIFDRGLVSAHWTGPPAGPSGYDIESDVGGSPTAPDGVINIFDRGTVSANWGRSVTLP